ncbi:hypothetical protein G9A89_001223 [Geosiphon pyriformis]|nr:hypothetical protein G9A89_001223 [Geosiphon pyriformis]
MGTTMSKRRKISTNVDYDSPQKSLKNFSSNSSLGRTLTFRQRPSKSITLIQSEISRSSFYSEYTHVEEEDGRKARSEFLCEIYEERIEEDVEYLLPENDNDLDQSTLKHHLLRFAWQSNFSSPISRRLKSRRTRVLDIGCGTGTWILDTCKDFPSTTFTGLDNSPNFPTTSRPKNTRFFEWNITEGLPFELSTFDLVHIRFLAMDLTYEQWSKAVLEIVRVTKSGGWIEICESDFKWHQCGRVTEAVLTGFRDSFRDKGINLEISSHLSHFLEDTKLVVNITKEEKLIPIGDWGNRLGELAKKELRNISNLSRERVCQLLEISPEQHDLLYERVEVECEQRIIE